MLSSHRKICLFFLLGLSCTSCSFSSGLLVRSEYIGTKHLASTQVNTPDPLRDCFQGQQIVIHWNCPQLKKKECKELILRLQYGNLTQENLCFEIQNVRGSLVHYLINQEYIDKKGIITYKIEVQAEGEILSCFEHNLWAELIEIKSTEQDS